MTLATAVAAALVGAVVVSPAAQASASTFYVATTGSDANGCTSAATPCATVQGAVTKAMSSLTGGTTDATVSIAAGTYDEAVSILGLPAGDSLSLVGAGAATTIIDATGTGTSVITVNSGGTVNVSGLTLTGGNTRDGGGMHITGGTVTVSESTISGNTASVYGGGIVNDSGTLTVSDSTFSGNRGGSGGGIANFFGTTTVSGSTFSGNTARYGGGIWNNHGTLTVSDSTLSGNTALYFGGGIWNSEGGRTTVSGSTISANTISGNPAFYVGGGIFNDSGTVTVSGSILSGNGQGDCSGNAPVTDGGKYNVTSDGSCGFGVTSVVSTVSAIGLGPLAANGSTARSPRQSARRSAYQLVPRAPVIPPMSGAGPAPASPEPPSATPAPTRSAWLRPPPR